MEIRNALQKIENYLTVVANLNKTILSEGTMSRDELLLMKKYLYTCIDRIEDIERSLIIDKKAEKSFTPTPPVETYFTPAKENEIVEVEGLTALDKTDFVKDETEKIEGTPQEIINENPLLENVTNTEQDTFQATLHTEDTNAEIVLPIENIITEDYSLNQHKNEILETPVAKETVEIPEKTITTTTFAQSIITEDYSLNNMFGNTAEAVNSALVNEAKPVETILPEVKQHIVSEIITEDYLLNKSNETQSLLIPEHSEINKENKVTEEAITTISTTTVNSLVNTFEQDKKEHSFVDFFEQKQKETLQQQLFEQFDDGKDELHEMFSSHSTSELTSTLETPINTTVSVVTETVLVAEKEQSVIAEELTPSSLNGIFKQQVNTETLNTKINKTLSESIALNDKFIFVRELFGNQFGEYENGLKQLDALNSYSLAENYCKEKLWEKFNWDNRANAVERFMFLLKNRYNV